MPIPTTTEITQFEQKLVPDLPDDFREFIKTYDGYQIYEHPKAKGKEWQLAALLPEFRCPSILDPAIVDPKLLYWQQSIAWADIIEENTNRDSTPVTDSRKRFKLDRMRECITIGEENGDFLLLDPSDDYAVWIYWHDGDDLQRLSDSFTSWIKSSKEVLKRASTEKTAPEFEDQIEPFCGVWTQKAVFGDVDLTLNSDGSAEERFDDGSGGSGHWRLLSQEIFGLSIFKDQEKSQEEQYKVLNCSPTKLSMLLIEPKHRVDYTRK